jgi:hypothetical protein
MNIKVRSGEQSLGHKMPLYTFDSDCGDGCLLQLGERAKSCELDSKERMKSDG